MALAGSYLRHSPTQNFFGTQKAREFQGNVYLVGYDSLSAPEILADSTVDFEITSVLQLLNAPVIASLTSCNFGGHFGGTLCLLLHLKNSRTIKISLQFLHGFRSNKHCTNYAICCARYLN